MEADLCDILLDYANDPSEEMLRDRLLKQTILSFIGTIINLTCASGSNPLVNVLADTANLIINDIAEGKGTQIDDYSLSFWIWDALSLIYAILGIA